MKKSVFFSIFATLILLALPAMAEKQEITYDEVEKMNGEQICAIKWEDVRKKDLGNARTHANYYFYCGDFYARLEAVKKTDHPLEFADLYLAILNRKNTREITAIFLKELISKKRPMEFWKEYGRYAGLMGQDRTGYSFALTRELEVAQSFEEFKAIFCAAGANRMDQPFHVAAPFPLQMAEALRHMERLAKTEEEQKEVRFSKMYFGFSDFETLVKNKQP